jgi:hypothetical protein
VPLQFGCPNPHTLVIFCCSMQAGSEHCRCRLAIRRVHTSRSSRLILTCGAKVKVTAPAREGRIGLERSSPGRVPLPDKVFTNSAGMLQRGGTGSESQPSYSQPPTSCRTFGPVKRGPVGGHVVAFECMPVNRLNTRVLEMVIITKENYDFDFDH